MKFRYNPVSKVLSVVLLSSLTLSLYACGGASVVTSSRNLTADLTAESVSGKEPDDAFCHAVADFSIRLLQTSLEVNASSGENVLLAPESVLTALAMTANGANGSTLTEMEQTLCGGMSIADFNPYLYQVQNHLTAEESVTFYQANSIWIRNDEDRIQVKESFLQTDWNYYQADAYYADFDDATVQDMNAWASQHTDGMISSVSDKIPEAAVLYLVNALAFEGAWQTSYEDAQITDDAVFTASDGTEETVTMLNSIESVYLRDEHASGFLKYYEGGNYAFLALLPEEGMTPEEYAASLTGESWLDLYQNQEVRSITVQIPEFTCDASTELSGILSNMGMEEAFLPDADFSNLADTASGTLNISQVLHNTHIEVTRAGTKAAAITSVEMVDTASAPAEEEPATVLLNRPFVYAIVDTESGLPVFLGIVNTTAEP